MNRRTLKTWLSLAATGLGLCAALAEAPGQTWNFETDAAGTIPGGWKTAETHGRGTPAAWAVIDSDAADGKHCVAITANRNRGGTFNLLLAKKTTFGDLAIKVRVKAVAGREDQGGGPVWRAEDADNYYVCRWNPLENNIRLYTVKNGRRKQLASADIRADTSAWHEIGVRHIGNRIRVEFDGREVIRFTDSTFTRPGMVGLWVKADGRSRFDTFKVEPQNGG